MFQSLMIILEKTIASFLDVQDRPPNDYTHNNRVLHSRVYTDGFCFSLFPRDIEIAWILHRLTPSNSSEKWLLSNCMDFRFICNQAIGRSWQEMELV
jgi:hypothetical protein